LALDDIYADLLRYSQCLYCAISITDNSPLIVIQGFLYLWRELCASLSLPYFRNECENSLLRLKYFRIVVLCFLNSVESGAYLECVRILPALSNKSMIALLLIIPYVELTQPPICYSTINNHIPLHFPYFAHFIPSLPLLLHSSHVRPVSPSSLHFVCSPPQIHRAIYTSPHLSALSALNSRKSRQEK